MENKINIAEILKDCPKGMKLYSPICGEVKFNEFDIDNERHPIALKSCRGTINFAEDGRFCAAYDTAECMLFPSSEMRDWSKFFKRGDVVYSKEDKICVIFEGWVNDDYTGFNTTINFYVDDASYGEEEICYTNCFVKASDEERATFIANAEKHYNGKYNPETLQVEPVKPECPFKPFDKVLVRDDDEKNGGRVCLHITMKTLNILMSVSHMYTHSASPTTSIPPTSSAQPTHTRKEVWNERPILP